MEADAHRGDVEQAALEIAELLPAVAATLRVGALFDGAASDLTANQMVTLILIGRAEGSRMRAGDIARHMSISAASATALIDRLVDFGMLTRARGNDRRIVWISVTDAGQAFIRDLKAGTVARIAAALANTTPDMRERLVDSLRQVTTFAQQFTDVPPTTQ